MYLEATMKFLVLCSLVLLSACGRFTALPTPLSLGEVIIDRELIALKTGEKIPTAELITPFRATKSDVT
jgi:hypothetical protein